MNKVSFVNNWETFTEARQDQCGVVVTNAGGLRTGGLSNCLCLVATDGKNKYGMLHVSPDHEMFDTWVRSLIKTVAATEAMITGANTKDDPERRDALALIFKEARVTVLDETKTGWMGDGAGVITGTNRDMVGYVALNAKTGEYAFANGIAGFAKSVNSSSSSSSGSRRRSQDGFCIIL